jgi:hypothetical protein
MPFNPASGECKRRKLDHVLDVHEQVKVRSAVVTKAGAARRPNAANTRSVSQPGRPTSKLSSSRSGDMRQPVMPPSCVCFRQTGGRWVIPWQCQGHMMPRPCRQSRPQKTSRGKLRSSPAARGNPDKRTGGMTWVHSFLVTAFAWTWQALPHFLR